MTYLYDCFTWQLVATHEMTRNRSVLVRFLLVFSLDDNVHIRRFHCDLIGRELLHVQDDLWKIIFPP